MRAIAVFVLAVAVAAAGCKRGGDRPAEAAAPTDAGPGNYARLGPVGLAVESVTLGKVRMRGMMGSDGESKDDVFQVRTRFKLFDADTAVRQPGLQRDGGLILSGDSGLKLLNEGGTRYRPLTGGGFDGVRGRRADAAVLTAESPEATDLLTFESVASTTTDLFLEVPGNYQVKQADGNFLRPKEPGVFRFRIPKALALAQPPAAEVGAWQTVGALSVMVESVRFGRVKVERFGVPAGAGESSEDALAVAVRVKLADPEARVKKPPFVSDGPAAFGGPAVTLRKPFGDSFPVLTAFGLDRIVGRQSGDAELTADKPEVTDLIVFGSKAGAADELVLTLWPRWKERKPDGTWADTTAEDDFRFRLPRSAWAK